MGKKPVETSERQKNERISLAEKRKIINEAEKGVSNALIMSQFKLNSPSVISMIMSRKEKYIKAFEFENFITADDFVSPCLPLEELIEDPAQEEAELIEDDEEAEEKVVVSPRNIKKSQIYLE